MDVRTAYRQCEEITWSQARNFSYGIRLLPPAKRQALAAVYAFARRIDDIGDGDLPAPDKLAALADARAGVMALAANGHRPGGLPAADAADPVLMALADAAGRFDIPLAAFGELIDGCEADVRGVTYLTFDDLLHYCRCVAGSIGRLSLGVFGTADVATAAPLADALGVALQLTNILRDIREDYLNGRVYLPAEDCERFGCSLGNRSLACEPGAGGSGANGSAANGPSANGSAANGPSANGSGASGFATNWTDANGRGAGGSGASGSAADWTRADWTGADWTAAHEENLAALVEFEAQRARTWYAKGLALMPLLDWRSAASAGAMAGIYFRLLEHIAAAPRSVLRRRVSLSSREKAMVAVRSLAMAHRPPGAARPGADRPATTGAGR